MIVVPPAAGLRTDVSGVEHSEGVLDRRAPKRGDQRRLALLRALDERLKVQLLDEINVADITAAAGVSRSAFYFYFEDKAACVAALGTQMHQEILTATRLLVDGDGSPHERLTGAIHGVFAAWRSHRHLFQAMLTARQRNQAVRELWDRTRKSFAPPLAALIDAERAAGIAPPGPDSHALATVLLELNERALEQFGATGPPDDEQRVETLIVIWWRAIYAVVPPDR
ncbi:TetR/AcrR family transcriptional regulator [Nocardia sp. BMG111209]|uniref:TetR/AcrR family transcriptional regulator n=1 Tax=Nocardia sp. BMG111209 TaxID=1160137 RepID=UPI00036F0CCF|nr:TetR/AcrR family transcriptional regulator [Nocardia sp. BMG111209]